MKKLSKFYWIAILGLTITACQSIPKAATPYHPFELEKYMGKWYEIARFDFKFEENLNNTTATYSIKENGDVKVINRGYNYVEKEWEEAVGTAKFRDSSNVAALKVSFFGPFYSGYNVVALEGDYQYALIAGKDTDYLWILSRTTSLPDSVKTKFLEVATDIGYDTSRLIWVEHGEVE